MMSAVDDNIDHYKNNNHLASSHPHLGLNKFLQRSDSLRSSGERSDDLGSVSSENKRVSFNNDVKIKRIPNQQKSKLVNNSLIRNSSSEVVENFAKIVLEAPPQNPAAIEAETRQILQQLQGIECSVSPSPDVFQQKKLNNNMRGVSTIEAIEDTTKTDNRLYGLHALNNLDIAVNGKEVNSMPSYHEIRRRGSSTNSSDENSLSRPPASKRPNNFETPPKPPRKAPSASPPSVRRGMTSTHYAQPAISGLNNSDMEYDSRSFRKRLAEATTTAEDSAIASGGDADDSTVTSSYTSRFIRKSPPRQLASSRLSPSRSCLTDTEILRSPSEVLYAVSDKHRHNNNEHLAHSSSQTSHENHHQQQPPQRPQYTKNYPSVMTSSSRPRSAYNYSSREDLVSNDESYISKSSRHRSTSENHRYRPQTTSSRPYPPKSSRSLDRLQHDNQHNDMLDMLEANKENTFKTRIQVISPDNRQHMVQNGLGHGGHKDPRKPYKTTINTATDNILYRGNSTDNVNSYYYGASGEGGGHYKVPRSKPVLRNGYQQHQDHRLQAQQKQPQSQFASTRLVKNMQERGRYERDRDGRAMHIVRNRNYSGHSTSPDRDVSPERSYNNRQPRPPPRSYSHMSAHRSPSTSPSRPPRSRSSPTREIHHQQIQQPPTVVRRMSSRRVGEPADRSPSVRTNSRIGGRSDHVVLSNGGHHRDRSVENNAATNTINGRRSATGGDDRLSRFTEYRGEDIMMPHAQDPSGQPRMATVAERERGQSLPPGATIENMRDFYKSSQYKSMYQLPPSPNRPAPVLDRGPEQSRIVTMARPRVSPSAGPRVSISEGDVTDEGRPLPGPPEKMPRHHRRPASSTALRTSSAKRQAPSPPMAPSTGKGLVVRRVVSSDGRRMINSNVQQPPAARRIVVGRRTSMDNGLDSSFSESEGFNGEADPVSPSKKPNL